MNDLDQKTEELVDALRGISLSSNEKREIKSLVFEYVNKSRVFAEESSNNRISVIEALFAIRSHAFAFALILLVVFAGSGVSMAAEDSLPGDNLYPVKVYFNEGLRGVLALNPSQKAHWNAKRAERRLVEAQRLAAEGRFNEEAEEALEQRLASHTSEAYKAIESLEQREDLTSAISAISELESLLSAHKLILASQLGEEEDEKTGGVARTQKEFNSMKEDKKDEAGNLEMMSNMVSEDASSSVNIASDTSEAPALNAVMIQASETKSGLLEALRNNISTLTENRVSVEKRLNDTEDIWLERSATKAEKKASDHFSEVEREFGKIKSIVNSEIEDDLEADIKLIEGLINEGEEALLEKDYSQAITKFSEAIRISSKVKILIQSHGVISRVKDAVVDIEKKIDDEESSQVLGSTTEDEVIESGHSGSGVLNIDVKKASGTVEFKEDETDEEAQIPKIEGRISLRFRL